jgi:hypothetical protein
MLKKGSLLILGMLFGDCDQDIYEKTPPPAESPTHDVAGARANDTGGPIGGGPGYGDVVDPAAARHVRTLAELEAALADNAPLIYVDDDATIDAGDHVLHVHGGTTLASGRGQNGSLGGMIFSIVDTGNFEMIHIEEGETAPVRITGLRLRGPDPNEHAPTCDDYGRTAVELREPDVRDDATKIVDRTVEIDNNELFAWKAAVFFEGVRGAYVHNNHFHHNRRHAHRLDCAIQLEFHAGGYGVDTNTGHTLISANFFQYNRHAIASDGRPGVNYEAYYNVVMGSNVSHSFDMHGGVDREDGTYIAGNTMIVAFNTLLDPDNDAVNVRGHPVTGAWVYSNELYGKEDEDILQTKIPVHCKAPDDCGFEYGRMFVFDNVSKVRDTAKWFSPPPSTPP